MWLFLGACTPTPDSGTAVGNPTGMVAQTASATALSWTSASTALSGFRLDDCSGGSVDASVSGPLDLLGGTIQVPAGTWCGLELEFSGNLSLVAEASDGSDATLSLAVPSVRLAGAAHTSNAGAWVLELADPGWTSAEELGAVDGASVVIDASSPQHDALVTTIRTLTTLYDDADEDGEVDDDERDDGLEEAEEEEDEEED